MSFKIADGYVEVHARHDRASTRRNAKEAADIADEEGKKREGSMLGWLFKSNPKIHKALESPIGAIFSSPIIFAAAAAAVLGLGGLISTALTTAILGGIAGGFIAGGIWVHANDKVIVGAYKSMQKKIKDVFTQASQPLVGPTVRAMEMIGDAVKRWEPSFKRIYTALAPLIEPFTGGVLGFIEAMLPGIERSLPGIQVVILALAEHLPGLGTAMGDFFATIAENGPLLKDVVGLMITWLENFFKVAGPVLVFFMQSFVGMAIEWKYLMDALKAGWKWVDETWHAIPGWWNETWGAVSGWFKELWNDITGFFTGTGDSISTWWNDQISQISGWWSSTWGSVSTWFSELPGKIGGFLSALPGIIGDYFVQAFDRGMYLIGFFLGSMVAQFFATMAAIPVILQTGWNSVMNGISFVWGWITAFIPAQWGRIQQAASTWPGIIGRFFLDMGAKVIAAVINMFLKVHAWWDALPGRLGRAAQDAWNRVYGWFSWAFTRLPQIVGDMNNRIVAAVVGLAARMYNAGRDAIMGLVNGINDLLGWAVDAAWRAAARIAQGFKDALGIASPSKLLADEVGKMIPKGIAVGIDANLGDLEKRAGMMRGIFTGARPLMPGSSGSSSSVDQSTSYGQVNLTVRIDKIQDLEDIKAFLNGKLGGTLANSWAGNIYEKTGEYERSYK